MVAAALAAGCGGDDEPGAARTTPVSPPPTTAEPETAAPTETRGERAEETAPPPETTPASPEDVPGGAGDEEPARSLAQFTGRGGRIAPRVVLVPPFISIRAELRSGDGREYALRGGGRTLSAGGGVKSASTTFAGLRPGERIVLQSGSGRVVIEASAEPGP